MSSFPKPPMPRPSLPSAPSPSVKERSGALTENEYSFILDVELKQSRRSDPLILAFIESFVRCKSISQASAECGIGNRLGYQIRHYVDVAAAIQKIIDKSAIKYGFDASEIMERTKEIVDFDPIAVQNPDGTYIKELSMIAPEARRNIKKLKVKNLWTDTEDINGIKSKIIVGEVIEYEFYDKLKAIDLAGKEKELFKTTTRVEHTVTKDMAEILLASAKRGQAATLEYAGEKVVEAQCTEVESEDE